MIPVIALNQIAAIQHIVTFNQEANALSSAVLFGVKESNGLQLRLYGGNYPAGVQVDEQTINLTPSATNYIYADANGDVFKVTAAPTDWPGPMALGWRALYQLTVGADEITSGTCYRVGRGATGPDGPQGATGASGDEIWKQRKRITTVSGSGSTSIPTVSSEPIGFAVSQAGSTSARTIGSGSLGESIPYVAKSGGSGTAAQVYSQNFCFRGNAAGRGGFDVSMRWYQECIFNPSDRRCFFGLFDTATGAIGDVEADTLTNIIGVASKAGDANLSLIHNDGSGTATMTGLGANFPAKTTPYVYELRLWCTANDSLINYSLTNCDTGNTASGTVNTNIPANTQFLAWVMWTNCTSASTAVIGFMQVAGYTRY